MTLNDFIEKSGIFIDLTFSDSGQDLNGRLLE